MSAESSEIAAIINKAGGWRGETLARLRDVVLNAGPPLIEDVKWRMPSKPQGVPVWSLDGMVCIGETLKNAVRLTFPRGAEVSDPKKLFNARLTSKSVRAIDFFEGEDVPQAAVKALVVEAAGVNTERARARAKR